jgi:ATP-dependent RNA helicase RhlE
MTFENLELIEPIYRALKEEGYTTPTPIQQKSIPVILQNRDLMGCAQTGTGKTAAFVIPILQLLQQSPDKKYAGIRALILAPTRELAIQIGESVEAYGKYTGVRHAVIFGGVSQFTQELALKKGPDIVIATPGRLLDLMNQRLVNLQNIKTFVLDEADHMLDMGFINDIKKIIARLPVKRQTLFFSATIPPATAKLANSILADAVKVEVTPVSSAVDSIHQSLYYIEQSEKRILLIRLLKGKGIESALVFTRTKHTADKVVRELIKSGIQAAAIHGNKSQNARQKTLNSFKEKQIRVLVATDIAARGIDVERLSLVINYEIPNTPETYIHRIGRTGRAGLSGSAISLCNTDEKPFLKDIQKLIGRQIPVVETPEYKMNADLGGNLEPHLNMNLNGNRESGPGKSFTGQPLPGKKIRQKDNTKKWWLKKQKHTA